MKVFLAKYVQDFEKLDTNCSRANLEMRVSPIERSVNLWSCRASRCPGLEPSARQNFRTLRTPKTAVLLTGLGTPLLKT
jgi:hypothetical protein